jgi:WD40 repeat protein
VFAASFDGSGRLAVSGGDDHTARIWDTRTGREIARLTGHALAVAGAGFDPSSTRMLTFGFDRMAMIWSIERSQTTVDEIKRLLHCFVPFELTHDQLQARSPVTAACRSR